MKMMTFLYLLSARKSLVLHPQKWDGVLSTVVQWPSILYLTSRRNMKVLLSARSSWVIIRTSCRFFFIAVIQISDCLFRRCLACFKDSLKTCLVEMLLGNLARCTNRNSFLRMIALPQSTVLNMVLEEKMLTACDRLCSLLCIYTASKLRRHCPEFTVVQKYRQLTYAEKLLVWLYHWSFYFSK